MTERLYSEQRGGPSEKSGTPRLNQGMFIRGRLRFSGKGPAPFPSALVVFGHFNYGKEMDIS